MGFNSAFKGLILVAKCKRNRNEYQEHFMGWGKDGLYVGLTTLPPSCADCREHLEPRPPGTLRAFAGIPLPLLHSDIAAATSLFRTAAIFFLVANIKHNDVVMTISVLLTKYHLGIEIEKNEIGGACGTFG
jgi:hypothetical protein